MKNNISVFSIFLAILFLFPVSLQAKNKIPKPKSDETVVRWNAVPFIKYYILEIKNSSGRLLIKKRLTQTSYKANFNNEGTYYYRLTLVNRLGITEAVSDWKKFEILNIRIPDIFSSSPNELLPRESAEITITGKNFNQRNQMVLHKILEEKEKGKILFSEKLGKSIPVKTKVKSSEKLILYIPPRLLERGYYSMSFLLKNKPLYLSSNPLLLVSPPKFISRLYIMPSFYWLAPIKFAPQRHLFKWGFGLDLRWGTRFFKKKMEVGVASGLYIFNPSDKGKKFLNAGILLPLGVYIGYNAQIPSKSIIKISFMPYIDIGYDIYLLALKKRFQKVVTKKALFIPKTNLGIKFLIEKNKLLFVSSVAMGLGIHKKKFIFSGIIVNLGIAIRFELIPKEKK